jgi:hypothetical protein
MAGQARSFTQIWKLGHLHHQRKAACQSCHPACRILRRPSQGLLTDNAMTLPRNLVKTDHIGLVFRALDPRPVRARDALRSVRRFTTGREGRRPPR